MTITVNIFPLHAIKCTILPLSLGPNVDAFIFVRLFSNYFCCFIVFHRWGEGLFATLASLLANITNFPVIMKHLGTSSSNKFRLVPISYLKSIIWDGFYSNFTRCQKKVIDKPSLQSPSSQIPKLQNQGTGAVFIISLATHNIYQSANI